MKRLKDMPVGAPWPPNRGRIKLSTKVTNSPSDCIFSMNAVASGVPGATPLALCSQKDGSVATVAEWPVSHLKTIDNPDSCTL